MIAAGYISKEQRTVAVVLLAVAAGFTFGGRSGYFVNHMDIAPRLVFAHAVIFSFHNAII